MTDLDKMARSLLAAEHEADDPASMTAERLRSGLPVMWWADDLALRAIRAALLTAPEGWKLVPVEPDDDMQWAATVEQVGGHCHMCSEWDCTRDDARRVWAAMIAAAPEVKP